VQFFLDHPVVFQNVTDTTATNTSISQNTSHSSLLPGGRLQRQADLWHSWQDRSQQSLGSCQTSLQQWGKASHSVLCGTRHSLHSCWTAADVSRLFYHTTHNSDMTPQYTDVLLKSASSIHIYNSFSNQTSPSDNLNDRWKRLGLVSWAVTPCVSTLKMPTRNLLTYLLQSAESTSTQPATLRGIVKWASAFRLSYTTWQCWVQMIADSQLGRRVSSHSVLFYVIR